MIHRVLALSALAALAALAALGALLGGCFFCDKEGEPSRTKQLARSLGTMIGKTMKASGASKPVGKGVHWSKLAPFLPDAIGDFRAVGAAKGESQTTGAKPAKGTKAQGAAEIATSRVFRDYKHGKRSLSVEVGDLPMAVPMMRMAYHVTGKTRGQVSLSGDVVQRHFTVEGHRAILLWRRDQKDARLQILVGDRFPLKLRLAGAEKGAEVIELAQALDLDGLARVRAPGEPVDLGAAPATQPSASQPIQPAAPEHAAPQPAAPEHAAPEPAAPRPRR